MKYNTKNKTVKPALEVAQTTLTNFPPVTP